MTSNSIARLLLRFIFYKMRLLADRSIALTVTLATFVSLTDLIVNHDVMSKNRFKFQLNFNSAIRGSSSSSHRNGFHFGCFQLLSRMDWWRVQFELPQSLASKISSYIFMASFSVLLYIPPLMYRISIDYGHSRS